LNNYKNSIFQNLSIKNLKTREKSFSYCIVYTLTKVSIVLSKLVLIIFPFTQFNNFSQLFNLDLTQHEGLEEKLSLIKIFKN
jgi:hypothetical protein